MALSKAERQFVADAIDVGAPKPFITSIIWFCRKMNIEPNYMDLNTVAAELDDEILAAPKKISDRRSSKE